MPAPPAAQIESLAQAALRGAGLEGADIPKLATAVGQTYGAALAMFLGQTMILPGIPAALDPISGSGATSGPGMLLPPPAGGPDAAQLEPQALANISGQGLVGENKDGLAKAVAEALGQGLTLFCSQRQIAPGIAIAGFVTVAPGTITGAGPDKGLLRPLVETAMQGAGLRGEHAKDLAAALAETAAGALDALALSAMCAPGIAAAPGATAAPGRLM